jgi:hypothetical protein
MGFAWVHGDDDCDEMPLADRPPVRLGEERAAGPEVSRCGCGPEISRPQISGPEISGPEISGPEISGPEISGPSVSAGPAHSWRVGGPPRGGRHAGRASAMLATSRGGPGAHSAARGRGARGMRGGLARRWPRSGRSTST